MGKRLIYWVTCPFIMALLFVVTGLTILASRRTNERILQWFVDIFNKLDNKLKR